MYYGYSDQILQVMADISSSKRNSKTGIEKVEYILINNKIPKIFNINDINKEKYYILPDKDGKEIFNIILKNNNIKFNFQRERQNKYPDILLKLKDNFYIVEHKMTNGDGGSQNAEINEIISFIKQQETNKKIHYISCLEGNFMSKLNIDNNSNTTKQNNKHISQYNDIIDSLQKYPSNYFVNGNGLKMLITNL